MSKSSCEGDGGVRCTPLVGLEGGGSRVSASCGSRAGPCALLRLSVAVHGWPEQYGHRGQVPSQLGELSGGHSRVFFRTNWQVLE